MYCPKCLRLQPVLAYKPLGLTENFVDEVMPVLKCPTCAWIFAPVSHTELAQLDPPPVREAA